MAKNKRKGKASTTRGKRILHPSGSVDHDHDSSYVLALCAPEPILLTSASSPVLSLVAPSSVCEEGLAATVPIPEAIPNPLEAVIVEDCSDDDPLVAALLDEEHLDFSFSEDDGEDMSSPVPPSSSVPPCSSGGPPPLSSEVPAGDRPFTTTAAGAPLASTPGSGAWKALFSTNTLIAPSTRLQNFFLNHLTKSCALSPEDFQPQFDVWNLCAIGYVAGKSPGFKALNGISSSVWKCEASLTIHDSGWLIYRFNSLDNVLIIIILVSLPYGLLFVKGSLLSLIG
ncbi:hypothetical protein NC653_031968 [Populus alba x Populus x berolinensis]|uniref:Uncharacterized protein n=1 Tax=Populus alba x Populus x berolinensis TaxID=444605 RepID=A0AAD6Q272_9ROSI|nr:hypothetical protein NC653_031968 [Populus alba x Populus x berolinensis]